MNILITGVAGFIGSHLLERLLLTTDHKIIGIDDFSNGRQKNLDQALGNVGLEKNLNFDLMKYRIGPAPCNEALSWWFDYNLKPDIIFHLAAWGSVPRSVIAPNTVFNNNIAATYEILEFARQSKCKRVVIASSSSVYGDNQDKIKAEPWTGAPLSPYAASKQCCESLAQAYFHSYGIETICLRFFNVFGPRQRADSDYAAVIPKWITALLNNEPIDIYGDGLQSRDFTYVDNVVDAIIKAGFSNNNQLFGNYLNVACGESHSLLSLLDEITKETGKTMKANMLPKRKGDILNSCADISRAREWLGYEPIVGFEEGIKRTVEYFKSKEGLSETTNSKGKGI